MQLIVWRQTDALKPSARTQTQVTEGRGVIYCRNALTQDFT